MKLYHFEVVQELVTHIDVMATSEQEARERVMTQGQHVTPFDTVHGDTRLVLRSVSEE